MEEDDVEAEVVGVVEEGEAVGCGSSTFGSSEVVLEESGIRAEELFDLHTAWELLVAVEAWNMPEAHSSVLTEGFMGAKEEDE